MKNFTYYLLLLLCLFVFPSELRAEDYYLIGDWNNWDVNDLTFKLQPVYGKDEVYSLYINAPFNVKGTYALRFVIKPGLEATTLTKCLRPTENSTNLTVKDANYSNLSLYTGGTGVWEIVKGNNPSNNVNNAGSYLFTIDMKNNTWSITQTIDTRVLYFVSSEHNGQFNGDYLIDDNSTGNSYNSNYTGLVYVSNGVTYKLCDGYNWYGQNSNYAASNSPSTVTSQKIGNPYEGYSYDNGYYGTNGNGGDLSVPFNKSSGIYYIEANVCVLTDADNYKFPSSRDEVNISDNTSGKMSVTVTHGKTTEKMTYDTVYKLWTTKGLAVDEDTMVYFTEKRYNGNNMITTITNHNATEKKGTYKAVYMDSYTSGTGTPVEQLMLTVPMNKASDSQYIRTFSDYYARKIPSGVTAYYVSAYDADTHTVTFKSIPSSDKLLPSNTACMLVYDGVTSGINVDADGSSYDISLARSTDAGSSFSDNAYYLQPLLLDVEMGPVSHDSAGNISTRNYYLSKQNGVLGFYRSIRETGDNVTILRKAYLALPAKVQTDASLDVIQSSILQASAKASYFINMEFVNSDDTRNVTGVTSVERAISRDGYFYTLQGVRVLHPSKGIYIHDGKKIIFK